MYEKMKNTRTIYLIILLQFLVQPDWKTDATITDTKETNTLQGPQTPFFTTTALEFVTIDKYLITAASKRSNPIYMVDSITNEELRTSEFLEKSYALAAELQNLGCGKGTIVGILSHNRMENAIVIMAVWLTGAAYTGLNPESPIHELQTLNEIVQPSIFFCSEENIFCEKIRAIAPITVKIITMDSVSSLSENAAPHLQYSQLIKSSRMYHQVENRPDDVATIAFSSGTTGLPKGITTTHKNIVFVLQLLEEGLYEYISPMVTSVTPVSTHISGLITALSALIRNKTFILMKEWAPRLFLSTIEKFKIKRLALAAVMVRFLVKDPMVDEYDLSSLEYIVCGGAPIKGDTEEALKKRLPNLKYVQQAYGMSETTFIVTLKHPTNPKAGTCGVPVTGVEIKIVDMVTGRNLGRNGIGEIYIRGPLVIKGYYGNEKATAEAIDADGWLRSGDVGYYDDDGDLFIVDRVKEMMRIGTWQVAPAELEAVLLTHPAILDAAVIGIADEKAGELPRAYVVKRNDAQLTEEDIIRFMTERVSPEKRLQGGVEFVSAIPKNEAGKILRKELREMWNKRVSTASTS